VREVKVLSEPEALVACFRGLRPNLNTDFREDLELYPDSLSSALASYAA